MKITRETNLTKLIKGMTPILNEGLYVFLTINNIHEIDRNDSICEFKEKEGVTVIMEQHKADALAYEYNYVASWITLKIHSSLDAVGLTAMFSAELAKNDISCNVIAGYYHDHIFVDNKDGQKAMDVLIKLSKSHK